MDYLTTLDFAEIFQTVTQWVGVAAMAASITPTDKDNKVVMIVKNVVDFIGFNFGYAKNKN